MLALRIVGTDGSLLPTPSATNAHGNQENSRGEPLVPGVAKLLPTPDAAVSNDGEDLDNWLARREQTRETSDAGNGFGAPLAIAVRLLPTPRTDDANNVTRDSGTFEYLTRTVHQMWRGESSPPPSPDGGESSDAPHHHQPTLQDG